MSIKSQEKKGDYLLRGFVSELPNTVYPKIPEIKKLQELKTIWEVWILERQNAFTAKYGDIALLLPVEVDKQLFKTIILFWDLSYRCFTFNHEDLTPTVEEYVALLRISHLDYLQDSQLPSQFYTTASPSGFRVGNPFGRVYGIQRSHGEN